MKVKSQFNEDTNLINKNSILIHDLIVVDGCVSADGGGRNRALCLFRLSVLVRLNVHPSPSDVYNPSPSLASRLASPTHYPLPSFRSYLIPDHPSCSRGTPSIRLHDAHRHTSSTPSIADSVVFGSGLARFAAGRRIGATSMRSATKFAAAKPILSNFGARAMATEAARAGKIHQVIGAVVDVVR